MPLKTDYKNDVFTGNRKYNEVINPDGTKSFIDVTEYEELGDSFGAAEINQTNDTINKIHVIPNPSPIKAGDDIAGNLLSWIEENSQWEKAEFGQPYDGTNIIKPGGIYIEAGAFSGEEGYRLYRQEDGTFSSDVRSFENYLGYILDENTAIIGVLGGVDKSYTEPMLQVNAFPGEDNEIWLQLQKPVGATGFLLHRSTTPYDGSGTSWGELVENITDDSSYHGEHNHYVDDNGGSGLVNGTQYYYNAFPYIGSTVNVNDTENETEAKAGGQIHAYYAESNALDAIGSAHGAASNIAYDVGVVGNAFVFDGIFGTRIGVNGIDTTFLGGNWTIFLSVKLNTATSIKSLLSFFNGSLTSIGHDTGKIKVWMDSNMGGTAKIVSATTLLTGQYYRVAVRRDTVNGLEIFINGVSDATNSYTGTDGTLAGNNLIGDQTYYATTRTLDGDLDEIIIVDRACTNQEIINDFVWHGGSV